MSHLQRRKSRLLDIEAKWNSAYDVDALAERLAKLDDVILGKGILTPVLRRENSVLDAIFPRGSAGKSLPVNNSVAGKRAFEAVQPNVLDSRAKSSTLVIDTSFSGRQLRDCYPTPKVFQDLETAFGSPFQGNPIFKFDAAKVEYNAIPGLQKHIARLSQEMDMKHVFSVLKMGSSEWINAHQWGRYAGRDGASYSIAAEDSPTPTPETVPAEYIRNMWLQTEGLAGATDREVAAGRGQLFLQAPGWRMLVSRGDGDVLTGLEACTLVWLQDLTKEGGLLFKKKAVSGLLWSDVTPLGSLFLAWIWDVFTFAWKLPLSSYYDAVYRNMRFEESWRLHLRNFHPHNNAIQRQHAHQVRSTYGSILLQMIATYDDIGHSAWSARQKPIIGQTALEEEIAVMKTYKAERAAIDRKADRLEWQAERKAAQEAAREAKKRDEKARFMASLQAGHVYIPVVHVPAQRPMINTQPVVTKVQDSSSEPSPTSSHSVTQSRASSFTSVGAGDAGARSNLRKDALAFVPASVQPTTM